jgi:hypothetical protein
MLKSNNFQTQVESRFIHSTLGELISLILRAEEDIGEYRRKEASLIRRIAELEAKLESK